MTGKTIQAHVAFAQRHEDPDQIAAYDALEWRQQETLETACGHATCHAMNTSSQRVQRRRDKLRASGLRPFQIWVPDTRAPGFAEECARQCQVVAGIHPELDAWLDVANHDLANELDRHGL